MMILFNELTDKERRNVFLTEVGQILIDVERMIKLENCLLSTYIVISNSRKKHQCNTKGNGETEMGKWYSLVS